MIKPDFKAFYEEVGGPHRCASSALPVDTPFDACSHDRAQCVLPGFPNMPPEAVPPGGLLTMLFFGFVNGWWPLRNMPNVLFLHFSEMKVAGYTFASTRCPPAPPRPRLSARCSSRRRRHGCTALGYATRRLPPPQADHEGSVRKIAAHLGYEPSAEQWPKILEYTSFKWMKEHQEKFEINTLMPFGPFILRGGMVRKGETGKD